MQCIFGEREQPNCLADVWCLWCCAYRCMAYISAGGCFAWVFLWRELIVKEHSKLWERQYIIIILKRRKFEVTIHHCPEVWCSFEVEIEYSICSAFVAFIVFIRRNTVGRVWCRQDIFPSPLVFQPLVAKLALSKMCFPLLSLSWSWAIRVSLSSWQVFQPPVTAGGWAGGTSARSVPPWSSGQHSTWS